MTERQAGLATARPDRPGTGPPPGETRQRPEKPGGAAPRRRSQPGTKRRGGLSGSPTAGIRPSKPPGRPVDLPALRPTDPHLRPTECRPRAPRRLKIDSPAAPWDRPPQRRIPHHRQPSPRKLAWTSLRPSAGSDPTKRSESPNARQPARGAKTSPAPVRRPCRQRGETCGPSSAARKGSSETGEGYRSFPGETIRKPVPKGPIHGPASARPAQTFQSAAAAREMTSRWVAGCPRLSGSR